ncbi:hypothetical protein ABVT39_009885 [Epinephelus coioides]
MGNDSSKRAHRSVEAFGSGLTLMNDSFIRPRQRSLPRMAKRCMKAFDSGVSSKRVWSKRGLIDFNESSHLIMDTGSLESIDSGVSLKSDRSKAEPNDFKDRVSVIWGDSFLSEKKHNVTYVEDWIKSSDSQRAERRPQLRKERRGVRRAQLRMKRRAHRSVEAFGFGLTLMNDSFIRPRQRSPPRMVLKSMEACGSSLSLMNDSFIHTGQRSPPREEMNQELSSEVGWKHN